MSKTQRDLIAVCQRIAGLESLHDRKVHLFIKLRTEGMTQEAIGQLVGMSDAGVIQSIKRHHRRHEKAVFDLSRARDEKEIAEAEAGICQICAEAEAARSVPV